MLARLMMVMNGMSGESYQLGQEGVWVELYIPRVVSLEAIEALGKALPGHGRAYLGKGCMHIDESSRICAENILCNHQIYI